MKAKWFSLAILLTLALESCSPLPTTAGDSPILPPIEPRETPSKAPLSTPLQESSTQEETQIEPSLPIPAISGSQASIEKAKENLAQRLSISTSQISLMESKEVFWPDSSLGCPQAGITYDQVLTPGYLIVLEFNDNHFEYHATIHNYVLYCENPTFPILETPENDHP